MNILSTLAKMSLSDIGAKGNVVTSEGNLINGILNTAYLWAGIICVIIIIIAGVLYTISAGDASKVKRAKDAIVGAIVGLVVIAFAFVITQFVLGRF